ncbi:CPBP family intramembrane glutamic endopeptidase [Microbulbifer taiwanensis]|uniref:CPBP family intramembrane glutamic endopeptidase n=1 Tax=Microbulbifer taiwanensis TaxID=986746 RepID=UPI003620E755
MASTGEEFAWRGFLQGQLIRQLGVLPGIFLIAAIWWAWHLPGLLFGYNFPDYPYFGAFVLFPLQMIGASLFLGWLTIKSGSFWPAALAHGAVNSVQQGLIDNLQLDVSQLYADLLRTGLILVVGVVCWLLLQSRQNQDRTSPYRE